MNTIKKLITMRLCSMMNTCMFAGLRTATASAAYFPAVGILYTLTNKQSNRMLNVQGSSSWSGANVTIYDEDGTTGELFKFIPHGSKYFNGKSYTKYVIEPQCAKTCALNVYGSYSASGFNVNIWTKSGNDTQDWILDPTYGGGYIIRSANNPSCVLTESGIYNMSNVKLTTETLYNKDPFVWYPIHRSCYPAY